MFIHLAPNPDPEQSENAPLFTGYYFTLKNKIDGTKHNFNIMNFLLNKGKYRTTPITNNRRFSRDNMTGVVCYSKVNDFKFNLYFWPQWLHPRDIMIFLYAKNEYLFFPFLPFISFFMILTCWQKYKVRNGKKIVKTDGKLMALMTCLAFNMDTTLKICTKIIYTHKYFNSWEDVAMYYYKRDDHPCVTITKALEIRSDQMRDINNV